MIVLTSQGIKSIVIYVYMATNQIEFVSKFYNGDLEKSSLSMQLETFTTLARNNFRMIQPC